MRVKTKIQQLKRLVPKKKNAIVFKPLSLNPKVLKNHKVLPFFLIRNSDPTFFKKSNEVMKVLWKLRQQLSSQRTLSQILPKLHIPNKLPSTEHLLNARIDFFTNKITLVGSLCWMWFFDIYENLNSTVESKALDQTLNENVELSTRKVKKKNGQDLVSLSKIKLSFLLRKSLLKNKRRNIFKLVKILKACDLINSPNTLLISNWLNSYKKNPYWKVRIKRPTTNNVRKRRMNPYLFLHNKSLNLGKPSSYSRELFYFTSLKRLAKENSRALKTIFFSRKKRVDSNIKTINFFNNSARKFLVSKLPTMHLRYKLLNSRQGLLPIKKKINRSNKKNALKNCKRQILLQGKSHKKRVGVYVLPILKRLKKSKTYLNNTIGRRLTNKQFKGFSQKVRILKFKHLRSVTKFKKKYPKKKKRIINLRLLFTLRVFRKYKLNLQKRSKLNKTQYTNFVTAKGKKDGWTTNKLTFLSLSNGHKVKAALTYNLPTFLKPLKLSLTIAHVLTQYVQPFVDPKQFKLDSSPLLYKSVILNSRTSKPLSFRNIGVFLWSQKKHFFKKNTILKFMFKKKIYSFLFPNEVRKSIMNRRKAFKSYRFIYKTSNFKKKKPYYSLAFFKNNHKNFFRLESMFQSLSSTKLLSNYKSLSNHMTREEILYEDDFANKGHIENLRSREIFIRRIRFKPGYQRIWRQAREAALEHFQIKTVYQQQLTKYLTKFYRQAHSNSFMYLETTLSRTIVYSRLLPDYASVTLFHEKNFLFLNGHSLPDLSMQVVPADFIQLLISNWFYIYNRWVTNTTLLRARKFKRLVYRKGMAGKYKIIKLRKQKSRYTPKWIYYSRFDHSDIKTYFEVDFFTMSAFVLYNPYLVDYSAPDDTIDLRISIYKMYNWKYIT